jgi:hypothetical protein
VTTYPGDGADKPLNDAAYDRTHDPAFGSGPDTQHPDEVAGRRLDGRGRPWSANVPVSAGVVFAIFPLCRIRQATDSCGTDTIQKNTIQKNIDEMEMSM